MLLKLESGKYWLIISTFACIVGIINYQQCSRSSKHNSTKAAPDECKHETQSYGNPTLQKTVIAMIAQCQLIDEMVRHSEGSKEPPSAWGRPKCGPSHPGAASQVHPDQVWNIRQTGSACSQHRLASMQKVCAEFVICTIEQQQTSSARA